MNELPRGIYTEVSKRPLLVCPTPEQIARVTQNPRARYFSRLGNEPVFLPETVHDLSPMYVSEKYEAFLLRNLYGSYLVQIVEERFRGVTSNKLGGNVGLRGTACSLDGHCSYMEETGEFLKVWQGSGWVKYRVDLGSFEEVMAGQAENGARAVMVEPVDINNRKRIYQLGEHPSRYLFYHPNQRRRSLAKHGVDSSAVFPILVAYNLDYCQGDFLNGYRVMLPQNSKEAQKAVLGAFVLDLPVFECLAS